VLGNVSREEGYFTVVVLRNPVKALLLNNEHQTTLSPSSLFSSPNPSDTLQTKVFLNALHLPSTSQTHTQDAASSYCTIQESS
jgi:hypothetical protein